MEAAQEPQAETADVKALGQQKPSGTDSADAKQQSSAKLPGARKMRLFTHPELLGALLVGAVALAVIKFLQHQSPAANDLFRMEQLKQYNGKHNAPLYLAILGEVYDVTKGKSKYGPGTSYDCFIGTDATRAFVTGDFAADLTDDVADFTDEQYLSLVEWRNFYKKEYDYKGRVVGAFYDRHGKPTPQLLKVQEGAEKAQQRREMEKELDKKIIKCNVRWNQAEGGHVWCDNGKYPRRIFHQLPGGKPTTRCACFEDNAFSDTQQLYDGCAADAHSCQVSPPDKK